MEWKAIEEQRGVLTASDEKLEWLLPWWWEHLSSRCSAPVAFVDFGMSACGRAFCQERGRLIELNFPELKRSSRWETIAARPSWLKKPFAMLATPFQQTIWLDLDCEVLNSIDALFDLDFGLASDTDAAIAKARSLKELGEDEPLYNSGVIAYRHASPLIEEWAQGVVERGEQFIGDQELLSRLIYEKNISIQELSARYNWRMSQGLNLDAAIVHWAGTWGKEFIRLHGGLHGLLPGYDSQQLFGNFK